MQKTLDKVAKTSRHLEEVRKQEAAALAERNVAIAEALEIGATQIQIAATANVSQAVVSRIERSAKNGEVTR